ncbi:hypothetical protein SBRCBS47491_006696 [Sporothrix bragantina]|uniref:Conserved oligomeric Golgi complex subunit 1 n=1 Tax=Sporothrix bragantina TaxID=671064 RepID=A0ABP0C728_9PEZI
MAITEPDVGLLTSSAQIFASNHTLPQIRAIHKSLHVQVEDKATRLRTQVGGSYRELLGTAETIVKMRGDMEGAQSTLAGMGGRCGRAVVGGKVTALASFVDHEQEQSALSLAARARLLEACSRTVGRLLSRTNPELAAQTAGKTSSKGGQTARQQRHGHLFRQQQQSWGERLILASKVLVLSRLLLSSIKDNAPPASHTKIKLRPAALEDAAVLASIEASKKSLGSLRRRLRDMIEVVERSVPTTASDKTEANGADDEEDDNGSLDGERSHRDGDNDDNSNTRGQHDRTSRAKSATATARDDLLQALCAHSLATTSGARDVLWQLLHVRSQAMALAFELDDDEHQHHHAQVLDDQPLDCRASWKADNVLRGLALYTKTLLDVQSLLPHRLPEALLGLKRRALLDDETLRQVDGLRLDVYARWCGEDVQYFKPYIRHDDLDAAQARDMLAKWAERGSEVLLSGLQRALEQKPAPALADAPSAREQQPPVMRRHLDLNAIVDLRTRVLQLWIRDSSKARGFDPSELLDKIRSVFSQQMLQVLATKVGKLRLVGSEVAATLASWQDGISDMHAQLWGGSGSAIDTDLTDGAVPFVRDVIARLHGRSDAVAKAVASYVTWRHVVDDVTAVVEQLRRQRWDIDIDDIVEDEDTIAQRQQLLSRDDPQTLHDRLEAALEAAFQELNTHIAAEWATVSTSNSISATTKGNIAMYLVRVLREIRSRRPASSSSSTAMNQLGLQIIPELHAAIAQVVVAQPVEQFAAKVLTRKIVAGRPLWDVVGQDTALPSTPSPGVFRFMRELSTSMGNAGVDLWSAAAVARLKQQVAEQLSGQWTTLLETADYLQEANEAATKKTNGTKETKETEKTEENGDGEEKQENGSKEDGEENGENGDVQTPTSSALTEDQRRDLLRQWLFDIAWLRCGFGANDAAGKTKGLAELEDAVFQRTGLAEDQEANSGTGKTPRQRVTKAAQEYWKKTALLFGLLA